MDDKQQIEALYREMYQAMIAKDTLTLNRIHADSPSVKNMETGCLSVLPHLHIK